MSAQDEVRSAVYKATITMGQAAYEGIMSHMRHVDKFALMQSLEKNIRLESAKGREITHKKDDEHRPALRL